MIRYLTAGESHGKALVGILEGMPAGAECSVDYINHHLWRRQQGYGRGGRMKIESDTVEILSGVRFGKTMGSPIALVIQNKDWENWTERMSLDSDGSEVEKITIPRPGHADFAGAVKYGFDDLRNVIDRASARETAMRVALCSIVRKFLENNGIFIGSHVLRIGTAGMKNRVKVDKMIKTFCHRSPLAAYTLAQEADKSDVRMLDKSAEAMAISEIKKVKKAGDTLGGIFEIIVSGVPIGLGSYVQYDRKLDGQLAQAVMSIQAIKGVEVGDGFENALKFGSQVHDEFALANGSIARKTNRAGGVEGSMSNGEIIVLRAAMKPIATLAKPLKAVDLATKKLVESRYERSDVCAVPAASVIGESVIAPVIANAFLEKYGGDSMAEISKRSKRN
ncbi:MAG: chorismate synthase [Ignavibacteriae bacterium]|nr:MAG: chorismate synthase [Ignavibacteriota bacterium]